MAMLLGVPVGKQIHMIDSLHYYTDNPLTEKILSSNEEESNFNIYDHVNPHHFGLRNESGVDVWSLFNECLGHFFTDEKGIWEGKLDAVEFYNDFSYLRDALHVARSFYFYKRKDYEASIYNLCEIKADDIFITCSEYLARNMDDRSFDSFFKLKERFGRSKAYVAISDYVLGDKELA